MFTQTHYNRRIMQLQWSTGVGATPRELPNYVSYVSDCEWHQVLLNWGGDTIQLSVDGSVVSGRSGGPSNAAFMTPALNATALVGTGRRYDPNSATFSTVVSGAQFEGCFRQFVGAPLTVPPFTLCVYLVGSPGWTAQTKCLLTWGGIALLQTLAQSTVTLATAPVAQGVAVGCPDSIFTSGRALDLRNQIAFAPLVVATRRKDFGADAVLPPQCRAFRDQRISSPDFRRGHKRSTALCPVSAVRPRLAVSTCAADPHFWLGRLTLGLLTRRSRSPLQPVAGLPRPTT